MYVRLGFAIAAHLEPDVLLVDEVLAVGDAEFQVKCLERIQELKARGTTSLFISHDLSAVERLCDRAILLEGGAIVESGPPREVVASYHRRLIASERLLAATADARAALAVPAARTPGRPRGRAHDRGRADQPHRARPEQPHAPVARLGKPVLVRSAIGREGRCRTSSSSCATTPPTARRAWRRRGPASRASVPSCEPPGGTIEFVCDALPLQPGAYYVGAIVRDLSTSKVLAWWDGETRVYVESGRTVTGEPTIPHRWRHLHGDVSDAPAASGAPRA